MYGGDILVEVPFFELFLPLALTVRSHQSHSAEDDRSGNLILPSLEAMHLFNSTHCVL